MDNGKVTTDMKQLTPLAQDYIGRFETVLQSLPGHDIPAIAALRKSGIEAFSKLDFPNHRIEEWRFTSLNALTKGIGKEAVSEYTAPGSAFAAPVIFTLVNGQIDLGNSQLKDLPDGMRLTSLATELAKGRTDLLDGAADEDRSVVALNTAFMEDGFVLELDADVKIEEPILIRFVSNAGSPTNARHFRNIVRLGAGAEAVLVEEHVSNGGHAYFSNPLTKIRLENGAKLHHYRLQNESRAAFHLAMTDCDIQDGAFYDNFTLSLGARLSRNEISADILGSGGSCALNGAYLMRDKQHCDTTTLTRHLVPENDSRQVYKGVLDGEARGIFQGKIHIAEDAQKVAGDQLSKALLLSDRATVACKPELEIYADDVKCSHGATSGELDEDALFYLQSRGIQEAEARKILITAFLTDVIDEIETEAVKTYFSKIATDWLEGV